MAESKKQFVVRESDLNALTEYFDQTRSGNTTAVRLMGPFGSGRRAAVGEMVKSINAGTEEVLVWRVAAIDQENGLQWLVRMYGSLISVINSDVLRRGRVELMLNAQLPSQPKRVQGWYTEFIKAMKGATADNETGAIKLQMPRDNPLIALIEVVAAIAQKNPIVLDLQNAGAVNSIALAQFVEALLAECTGNGGKLMVILHSERNDEVGKSLTPAPLLDLYERVEVEEMTIEPWGEAEVQAHLESRGQTSNAAEIARIANGRPGFVAELIDILADGDLLDSDLSDVTLASLSPTAVDASELEIPKGEQKEDNRKHAIPEDLPRLIFLAALLGTAFPSNIVADMGGYDRDSVDDLIDAAGSLFEEVQFSENLGTWIYKFSKGSWREAALEPYQTDEGKALALAAGQFMERALIPRGYGFISRTARVYAEHAGATRRASAINAMAMSRDNKDIWGLGYDMVNYFDDVDWPVQMRRTIFINLIDRLVSAGNIPAAQNVHEAATQWASDNEEATTTAWLLLKGSMIDAQKQDLLSAKERANDALTMFKALENKARVAETLIHLAQLDMADGESDQAVEKAKEAIEASKIKVGEEKEAVHPAILAGAEFLFGRVARQAKELDKAVEHFQRANGIAGQANIPGVAINAGVALGEALLVSGKRPQALEVLRQMTKITGATQSHMQERSANELLAQAEAAEKNFGAAITAGSRALEISKGMKLNGAVPLDLFNLGRFNFMAKNPSEALALFKEAAPGIAAMGQHPVVKEFYYFQGVAMLQQGQLKEAKSSLESGLGAAKTANDLPKVVSSLDHLAIIEEKSGNKEIAKQLLNNAIQTATQAQMKEAKKHLKKRLSKI